MDERTGKGSPAFDRGAAFGELAELLLDVDAPGADREALESTIATLSCLYLTGAADADDMPDFVAAVAGDAEAVARIGAEHPRLDLARFAEVDPRGVFGPLEPRRGGIARLVLAKRMAAALEESYASAFPGHRDLGARAGTA